MPRAIHVHPNQMKQFISKLWTIFVRERFEILGVAFEHDSFLIPVDLLHAIERITKKVYNEMPSMFLRVN
jgi:hypothetical protein